jgi:hypothetical protein
LPIRPVDPSTSTRGFVLSITGSFHRSLEKFTEAPRQ